jgi:hypothetical protein
MARNTTFTNQPVSYLFNNFRPVSVTMRATPYTAGINVDHDLGLFISDKWTISRFTIGLGLVAANADFRHRCRRPRGSDEVVHPQSPAPARRSSRVAC